MKRNLAAFSAIALSTAVLASVAFGTQACALPDGGLGQVVGAGATAVTGSVTTYHNDLARDGDYPYETQLTPASVMPDSFGKIGALPVDGLVYAQPLVAHSVPMSDGSKRDLVLVATEHDSVYAFDANTFAVVWRNNFVGDNRGGTGDVTSACSGCTTLGVKDTMIPNISPEVGITATPVLDPDNSVLYVLAASKDGSNNFHMQLHALDITNGSEQGPSPVEIQGTFPGTGTGNISGTLIFDPSQQLSRAGLALVPNADGSGKTVMFGFSSFDDRLPARGWFFAYDSISLAQTGTFVTTPGSALGSIWMAGGAPAADAQGNIYFATGNGDPNNIVQTDLDESVVKLSFDETKGFTVADSFTTFNRTPLDDFDIDLGSGGVMLWPDLSSGTNRHLLVQGGKGGTIYLLNRDPGKLGGLQNPSGTRDTTILQELSRVVSPENPNSNNTGLYSTPTYWNGRVYVAAVQSTLRSFALQNGLLNPTPVSVAGELMVGRGASSAVSSNGSSSGVIWLVDDSAYGYSGWNPNTLTISGVRNGPAVLYAYDPEDLSAPLYASNAQGSLDNAGNAVKFTVPTIALGHVYVGTQTEVSVYGLLGPRTVPTPTPTPQLPTKLSDTGFFTDLASLTPASGLIEYDVNSPLWSDNALKRRWLKLPAGQQIAFDGIVPWNFPIGTQMIKHFSLALADGTTTNLETRVLTYGAQGWSGVTYQWTQDQSDAILLRTGGSTDYTVNDPSHPGSTMTQTWHFPSSNDCLSCHTSVSGYSIGVNARQLNKNFAYPSGTQNQLAYLNSLHLFTQDIGDPSQYGAYVSVGDPSQTLTDRSRSYLATNCSFCHQPGGPTDVGMDFRAETDLADTNTVDVTPLKGNGGVTGAYILTPGSHAASVMWLRMSITTTGRMPPLGSYLVDNTAVSAVGDWIDSLPASTPAGRTQGRPIVLGKFPGGRAVIKYLPVPAPRPNSAARHR